MRKAKVYRSTVELPHKYVTVEEIEKNYEREAAKADRLYGPHVPPLTPRGRPRRGVTVEKTKVHAIRVRESAWKAVRSKARELGITTNTALQLAVTEWATRSR